jgi:hypothetical protein
MKLHYAAALALVGWYLMMPPQSNTPGGQRMAALSHWAIAGSFDTEKDCDAARVKSSKKDPTLGKYRGMPAEEIYDAQCIRGDDPRLKSN